MSFFPATVNGVADECLPAPRIIRGGDQRIPTPPVPQLSYTEQLEHELERALARGRMFERQVEELKGLLEVSMQAGDRAESDNKKLRLELARSFSSDRKLTPQQLGNRGLKQSRRRAKLAKRGDAVEELVPGVVFDQDAWRLVSGAITERLSPNEAAMFRLLLAQRGRTVEHSVIGMAVWKAENEWDVLHGINVLSCRLRKKLARVGIGHLLTTVPGIGYRLERAR